MTCHQHHPINATISSATEVDELASELADDYIEYFKIDISKEKKRYEDSIEECLAHLEEVISALDSYKQKGPIIDVYVATLTSKKEPLEKLYEQVDSIEQYVFETNRLLDRLDQSLRDLENHQPSGSNKFKQILGLIPLGIPRLGIFNSLSGIVDVPTSNIEEQENSTDGNNKGSRQLKPIRDILQAIAQIETDIDKITASLYRRLSIESSQRQAAEDSIPPMIAALNLDSTEKVDNSWQELL